MKWVLGFGIPVVLVVALMLLWSWDWFIPVVAARASAALGRPVTIRHLHVALGGVTRVVADGVTIANPPQWEGPPFATAEHLITDVDVWNYVRHGQLIIPLVAVQQPLFRVAQTADGNNNYMLRLATGSSGGDTRIGDLRVEEGHAHVVLETLRADFNLDVATRENANASQVVVQAHGTYNAAPIKGHMIAGALLSLRDTADPWPIEMQLANGPTQVALNGTLQDPLHLQGANLKLQLAGQDMSQLTPLTGIPIAKTPPYRLSGRLTFAEGRVQFRDFAGKVGSSDLEGTVDVDPGKQRPAVRAELRSHQVDLADLGGFIGTEPGRVSMPGQASEKRAQVAQAEAKPGLLPDKPLNLSELRFADIQLRYRGTRILGKSVPLDDLQVALDINNGAVTLHPLSFGVGAGRIKGNVALTPQSDKAVHAKANIEFQRVDVSRLMAATHMFEGVGTISGASEIEGTGNSLAAILSHGSGGVRLGMVGGDLSSLLVDLSGLEFGNALLSALGVPKRTPVQCGIDDMAMQNGVVTVQALVVDTGEAIINGSGNANLGNEALDLQLRTEAKHFSIGSLPAPINIGGTLKHPKIMPGAELAARGGLAAGLGVAFPPLALLPTIQLGVGDDHRCDQLLAQAKAAPGGKNLPRPQAQESAR